VSRLRGRASSVTTSTHPWGTAGDEAMYLLLALLLWRGPIGPPRGLYCLAFPKAYDRSKVRRDLTAA